MVRAGADPVLISRRLFVMQPASKARLMTMVLPTLSIEPDGRIAGMTVTAEMMNRAKAGPDALEGFVEFPMSIEGVQASYLLREVQSPEGVKRIKCSLRTTEKIDAVEVTGLFGGGGHRRASGFTTDGTLDEIRLRLVEQLQQRLTRP
jgi:bifunctional oligoribonuclease and PAP phosphatase NrnA